MNAQNTYYVLGGIAASLAILSAGGGLVLFIFRIGRKIGELLTVAENTQADVKLLQTNHLPHMYDRLGNIEFYLFGKKTDNPPL